MYLTKEIKEEIFAQHGEKQTQENRRSNCFVYFQNYAPN
jgi:hypothetical protein